MASRSTRLLARALLCFAACTLPVWPLSAQTIRYAYDDAGRMTKVTAPAGRVADYTYDAAGLLVRTDRRLDPLDGVEQTLVTHRRYDLADRTTRIAHVINAAPASASLPVRP
jgi:YD repeat-containing protein